MLPLLLSAAAVIGAAALFIAGNMLLGTTLALSLAASPLHSGAIGLILVQYSVGFVLGTLVGPRLIRRVGHIRSFAAFAAIGCSAALVHAALYDPWLWAVLRLISGACGAILLVVLESWINHYATPATRGSLLGAYMLSYYLAGASGQWLVGLAGPENFRSYLLAAGLLVLASVPLTLTRGAAPAPGEARRIPNARMRSAAPLSFYGCFIGGFSMSAFFSLAPVHATRVGFDAQFVAGYMAAAVLACMMFQWPFGRLADRHDRRRIIIGIAALTAFSAALIGLLGAHSATALTITTMLYTGLLASLYPACLALANDQLPGDNLVGVNTALLLTYGVGQITGPIVIGILMAISGPQALYYGVALALLLFVIYAVWSLQQQPPVELIPNEPFVPNAAVTPVISELDPRAESPVLDEPANSVDPSRPE